MTTTQTAADAFTTAACEIVHRTGWTVDDATTYLYRRMLAERPELLAKVAKSAGLL